MTPRGGRDTIEGLAEGADGPHLKLRVRAPAEGGKANDAVIRMLAKAWGLPASRLRLVSGASTRRKIIEVAGDPAALSATLGAWFDSQFPEGPKFPKGPQSRKGPA